MDSDGRWMTYGELAEARGIDRQSARRLASRLKWQRQTDNQQTVRVYVPEARAERPPRNGGQSADISHAINALAARAEPADRRADAAEAGRNAAEARADDERSRADALRDRLAALQGEFATAQAMAAEAEAAKIAQAEAEADTAELRQAEATRQARGRWARLRAAWQGE